MRLQDLPENSVIELADKTYIRHDYGWQNVHVYYDFLEEDEVEGMEFKIVSLPIEQVAPPKDFSPEVREQADAVVRFAADELNIHLTEWQYRLVASMIENPDKTIEMRTGRKGPHWALVEKEANG